MRRARRIFRRVPDPRAENARHELVEVLLIALAATLCGAEAASDMAVFGRSKEGVLRQFLRLEHGIPSHDTFSRVFRLLDPQAFGREFRRFMAAFARFNGIKLGGVVAIDGKALRGAYERGRSATPLHMVNVFAAQARMVLASCQAPGRNEAAGALAVLGMLSLQGLYHHRRCAALSPQLRRRGPRAGRPLRAGAQAKSEQAVPGGCAPLCSRRTAQHGQTPRTCDARSARNAKRHCHSRPATWPSPIAFPASSRWRASPPAAVGAASSPTSRSCDITCSPLAFPPPPPPRRRAQPLGDRESAALDTRCRLRRRRRSSQEGGCPGEPCHPAPLRHQHHSLAPRSHLHATEGQASRMKRRLPPLPPWTDAIALPSRGGV